MEKQHDFQTIAVFEKKEGRPRLTPVSNTAHGFADLAKLLSIPELRHFSLIDSSPYTDNFGRKSLRSDVVFTFTRTGPQEFANETAPWWETLR